MNPSQVSLLVQRATLSAHTLSHRAHLQTRTTISHLLRVSSLSKQHTSRSSSLMRTEQFSRHLKLQTALSLCIQAQHRQRKAPFRKNSHSRAGLLSSQKLQAQLHTPQYMRASASVQKLTDLQVKTDLQQLSRSPRQALKRLKMLSSQAV